MLDQRSSTLQKILAVGMEEFQERGFRDASLRNIVKTAGVTTGAFYGYFSSKEALFASIVEPHAAAVMGRFMTAQTDFADLPRACLLYRYPSLRELSQESSRSSD